MAFVIISVVGTDFYAYFAHIYREMHQLFPRRNYLLVHLDEYNTFRPLPCFVRPMLSASVSGPVEVRC